MDTDSEAAATNSDIHSGEDDQSREIGEVEDTNGSVQGLNIPVLITTAAMNTHKTKGRIDFIASKLAAQGGSVIQKEEVCRNTRSKTQNSPVKVQNLSGQSMVRRRTTRSMEMDLRQVK